MKHTLMRSVHIDRTGTGALSATGLLDVEALAGRLGVTPRFVRRLVQERRVPFLKIGKFVRFDPQEIEEWIDDARRPSIPAPSGP